VNILVGMLDYLGMSEECVLLLLAHCKRIGKVNLRAIEKYAYPLVERGITSSEALEEEIRTVEALRSFEGQIRTMFGMKSRALTSREDKMLRAWVSFGYDEAIVRRAYELTVQATGDASLPYANSILERWHSEGLSSAEEIDRSIAEEAEKRILQKGAKGAKAGAENALGNSFDTDDYFEAALRRSFRETAKDSDS
jgi:DnaD/phage-associated family protein